MIFEINGREVEVSLGVDPAGQPSLMVNETFVASLTADGRVELAILYPGDLKDTALKAGDEAPGYEGFYPVTKKEFEA